MTNRPGKHPRITREELDRLFDRELDTSSRRDLVGRLPGNPDAIDEINDVRGMVHSMRLHPDETPDLTAAVLDRLDDERRFLPATTRRRVKFGRLAVAASLLLGILGIAISQRIAPERFRLRPTPTPVADLGSAVRDDAGETRERLASTVRELASAHADARLSVADGAPAQPGFAADAIVGTASVFPLVATDEAPGLAVPVAQQYLTLTISADAEVLAFDTTESAMIVPDFYAPVPGGERFAFAGSAGVVSGPVTGVDAAVAFAVAHTRDLGITGPAFPQPMAASVVGSGVLPLSFSANARAAYVGRTDQLSDSIRRALNAEGDLLPADADRNPR